MIYWSSPATAEFFYERYDEAIECYQKSIQRNSDSPSTLRLLMSAYALKGYLEKANYVKAKVLKQNPNYSIEDVTRRIKLAYRNGADFEHTLRGLRLAGVPET